MRRNLALLLWLLLVGLAAGSACTDDGGSLDPGDDDDTAVPGDDDDDDDDDDDSGSGDDDDAVGSAVVLSGVVTRGVPPVLDGIGTLVVRVFSDPPPQGELVGDWVLEDADFSASDAEIPYEITGLGAQASPFSIICFLDDDESGGRPDENDMRIRPRIELVMDQGGNYTQNIEFNGYGTPPGGGDDDDSTGDDDDSTGDDDDSTGDDDDSTGDDDSAAGDDDSAAGDDDDSGGR